MSRMIGWICYAAVMAWPGAWPSGALASWMLAWAGDYANTPPNAELSGPRPPAAEGSRSNDVLSGTPGGKD